MDRISWEGGGANPAQSTLFRLQPHKNDLNKGEEGGAGGGREADQEPGRRNEISTDLGDQAR